MHGNITSAAEVTNISKHGFWLLLDEEELLLPFEQFPWFRSATVEQTQTLSGRRQSTFAGQASTLISPCSPFGNLRHFRLLPSRDGCLRTSRAG
jgi:hypothetical protein